MLTRTPIVTSILATLTLGAAVLAPLPANADPCGQDGPTGGSCGADIGGVTGGGGGGAGGGGSGGVGGGGGPGLDPGLDPGGRGVPVAPGGDGAPPISTVAWAQSARDEVVLPSIELGTAPSDKTYVQLRTALFIADGYEPRTITVDEIPTEVVRAKLTPTKVVWNLVDGTEVCQSAGSKDDMTCSHVFSRSSDSQPGKAYRISATITWTFRWTCEGVDCDELSGTLDPLVGVGEADLPVGEIQTGSKPG